MDIPNRWQVVCQDPGDGSGDVIVNLPADLLEKLGWALGDGLAVESSEEGLALKLKSRSVKATL